MLTFDGAARCRFWLAEYAPELIQYGIMESIISGVWPDLGLGVESDHQLSHT